MRPFEVVSALSVEIPLARLQTVSGDLVVANANPFCPLPFEHGKYYAEGQEYGSFQADLSQPFIDATIISRGRPHISLLHVALFDDNVATLSFPVLTGKTYGEEFRYLESAVAVCFHREVFYRGALRRIPKGATEVDRYTVVWELLPADDRFPMLKRGIFRGICFGHDNASGETIRVVSWEGGFFRRRGVFNQKN